MRVDNLFVDSQHLQCMEYYLWKRYG